MGFDFPYLYDETQDVARAYKAACTPDFFLFDEDFKLVYRGQFDGSRPGNGVPVTGEDLRAAIDAVLAGEAGRGAAAFDRLQYQVEGVASSADLRDSRVRLESRLRTVADSATAANSA